MSGVIVFADVASEITRLSTELDQAQEELVRLSRDWAYRENEYRKAKANSFLASEGTVQARTAHVDKVTDVERYAAHLAEGLKTAALEAVRNKRTQISALQTLATSLRSEMDMAGRS